MGLIEKIKLLFKARQPAIDIINEVKGVKSGWKTIPFWITLLGSAIALVAALKGFIPLEASLVSTTALTFLYNVLRGATKADVPGTKPILQTSEFWLGVLAQLSNAFLALQTGGISPEWIVTASGVVSLAMGAAQNLAGQQPTTVVPAKS